MSREDWENFTPPKLFAFALEEQRRYDSVLDVGCGVAARCQYVMARTRVGLDLHAPYFDRVKGIPGFVPVVGDALRLAWLFPPQSFDLVLLLGIVEHFARRDAIRLIAQAKGIARVAVLVETPLGWSPQDRDILGFGAHSLQTHRSAWKERDFRKLGFQTRLRDYTMTNAPRCSRFTVRKLTIKQILAAWVREEE